MNDGRSTRANEFQVQGGQLESGRYGIVANIGQQQQEDEKKYIMCCYNSN